MKIVVVLLFSGVVALGANLEPSADTRYDVALDGGAPSYNVTVGASARGTQIEQSFVRGVDSTSMSPSFAVLTQGDLDNPKNAINSSNSNSSSGAAAALGVTYAGAEPYTASRGTLLRGTTASRGSIINAGFNFSGGARSPLAIPGIFGGSGNGVSMNLPLRNNDWTIIFSMSANVDAQGFVFALVDNIQNPVDGTFPIVDQVAQSLITSSAGNTTTTSSSSSASAASSTAALGSIFGGIFVDGVNTQLVWVAGLSRMYFNVPTKVFDGNWHMLSLVNTRRGKERVFQLFVDAETEFFSNPDWRQCHAEDTFDPKAFASTPGPSLVAEAVALDSAAVAYNKAAMVIGSSFTFTSASSEISLFDFQFHPVSFTQRRLAALGADWMKFNLKVSRLFAIIFATFVLLFGFAILTTTIMTALYKIGGYDPLGWKVKASDKAALDAQEKEDKEKAVTSPKAATAGGGDNPLHPAGGTSPQESSRRKSTGLPAPGGGPLEQQPAGVIAEGVEEEEDDDEEEDEKKPRKKVKKLAQRGAQRAAQATVAGGKSGVSGRSSPLRQLALIVPMVLHVFQGMSVLLKAWQWPFAYDIVFRYVFFIFTIDLTAPELEVPAYVTLVLQLVLCAICLFLSWVYSQKDDKTFSTAMVRYKAMQAIYEDLLVWQLEQSEMKCGNALQRMTDAEKEKRSEQYLAWVQVMQHHWKGAFSALELEKDFGLSADHANEMAVLMHHEPPKDAMEAMLMTFNAKTGLEFNISGVAAALKNGMPVRESFRAHGGINLKLEQLQSLGELLEYLLGHVKVVEEEEEAKRAETITASASMSVFEPEANTNENSGSNLGVQSPRGGRWALRNAMMSGSGSIMSPNATDLQVSSPLNPPGSPGARTNTFGSGSGSGSGTGWASGFAASPTKGGDKDAKEKDPEGEAEEAAVKLLEEIRRTLNVPMPPPTVVPPTATVELRLTHLRQCQARASTAQVQPSATSSYSRRHAKNFAGAGPVASVKDEPLTEEERQYSATQFPLCFKVQSETRAEKASEAQLLRSSNRVVQHHQLKEGYNVGKVFLLEEGGAKRHVEVVDCVPYVYIEKVEDEAAKKRKKEEKEAAEAAERKRKQEEEAAAAAAAAAHATGTGLDDSQKSDDGIPSLKEESKTTSSAEVRKKDDEGDDEENDGGIIETRSEIRIRLRFPMLPQPTAATEAGDAAKEREAPAGPQYTEEIFRLEVTANKKLRCPTHDRHMVPATEDRHYAVVAPDGRTPYHCTFTSWFAYKQCRDPGGIHPCSKESLYVCADDGCPYTICNECSRLKGSRDLIPLGFAKLIYTIKHLKNGILPVMTLLFLQALMLPVTQNCFMIISCHPVFQCELPGCYRDVTPIFGVTVAFAVMVFIFFRCGLAVFWSLLLFRRRSFLIDRKPSPSQWDLILAEDQSVMSALYRKYEYRFMAIEPIVVLCYQVGLALATSVPEPNSAAQLVLAACVELGYGLFLTLTNPFIDPWVDLLAKCGSAHQLLQMAADAFHRVAQHDDPTAEWVGAVMVGLTFVYLFFVFYVLWRTVIGPYKELAKAQYAEGLLRQEVVHLGEPDDARALACLQRLLKAKIDHYGKAHFQTAVTMAHCYGRADEMPSNNKDSGLRKSMEYWQRAAQLILRKQCKGILLSEPDAFDDARGLNGYMLNDKTRQHLARVLAVDVTQNGAITSSTAATTTTSGSSSHGAGGATRRGSTGEIKDLEEEQRKEGEKKERGDELVGVPFTDLLLEIIKRSNWDSEASISSANSISLLSDMKFVFEDEDFSRVRIPWAVVEGTKMNRVDFTSADLTGASFAGTFYQNVNYDKAILTQTKFGMQKTQTGTLALKQVSTGMRVKSLAWYPNEVEVAVVGEDVTARIFNVLAGTPFRFKQPLDDGPDDEEIGGKSPSSSDLLGRESSLTFGSRSGAFSPDLASLRDELENVLVHPKSINSVGLSFDATILVTGCQDGVIRCWDLEAVKNFYGEKEKGAAEQRRKEKVEVAAAKKRRREEAAAAAAKQKQREEEAATAKAGDNKEGGGGNEMVTVVPIASAQAAAVSPPFGTTSSSKNNSRMKEVSPQLTPEELEIAEVKAKFCLELSVHAAMQAVNAIALAPDDGRILSGGEDKVAYITTFTLEPALKEQQQKHQEEQEKLQQAKDAEEEENKKKSGAAGDTAAVAIVPPDAAAPATPHFTVLKLEGHKWPVTCVAWSPDGHKAFTGSQDKSVRIWDAKLGFERARYEAHTNAVSSLAISPDGRQVASAGTDKLIRLWDPLFAPAPPSGASSYRAPSRTTTTGSSSSINGKELSGHTNTVQVLKFGPEGKRLISGSQDGTMRLWDMTSTKQVGLYEGHKSTVYALCFSPDGSRVVSGSWDRTVRLWDTTPAGK